MKKWTAKKIQGKVYSLSHLDPFVLSVTPTPAGSQTYRVRVSFGLHTFSTHLEPEHTPDMVVRDGRDVRCFCTERYALSQSLPELVQAAAAKKAFFSHDGNYVVFEHRDSNGARVPYAAFFDLRRSEDKRTHDAAMFIKSAYLKPNLPKRMDAIKFATLVAKVSRGEAIVRPY